MSGYSIQLIGDTGKFDSMEEEWDDLAARDSSAMVFQSWKWHNAVWHATGGDTGRELLLIRVQNERDGRLVGLFPLCLSSVRVGPVKIRRLEMTGGRYLDHQFLIIDDTHRAEVLPLMTGWVERNRDEWDLLDLKPVRSESLDSGFSFSASAPNMLYREAITSAPYLKLMPGQDIFAHLTDGSFVKYLKRKIRKIEKDFECRLLTVSTESELAEYYPLFVTMNKMRSRDKLQKGIFRHPVIERMLLDICMDMLNKGLLRFFFLLLDGVPAACLLNFISGNKMIYYQSGLNLDYRKYSTGHLIHYYGIRNALESGLEEYDFLNGEEAYKTQWTATSRPVSRLLMSQSSWKSRLLKTRENLMHSVFDSRTLKSLYFKWFARGQP